MSDKSVNGSPILYRDQLPLYSVSLNTNFAFRFGIVLGVLSLS